jgi:hypothetical protein
LVDEFKAPPAEGLTIRIADRRVGLVMHEKISASARSRQIGSGIGRLPIFYVRGKNLVIIKSSGASIATVRAQTRPHFKLNHAVVNMEDNVN